MAGLLNVLYSLLVLLVAVVGIAFVFFRTDASGVEDPYSKYSVVAAVVLFLVVMIGLMIA